jgi:hypothetical protein
MDGASDPDRSQTVIFLDAAILDTLIAVLLPGSHGVNYSDGISAIKISIRPRMLVIKSVTLTVGAVLNAHGLGVLAPAIGRITTKILVPTLNLLLGPDCRHDKLMKLLDLADVGLYTANGRPADSPAFRRNLSDWVVDGHGAARPGAAPGRMPGGNGTRGAVPVGGPWAVSGRMPGGNGTRGVIPVGGPWAAGPETPRAAAPPRGDLLPSRRPHRQGPRTPRGRPYQALGPRTWRHSIEAM